MILEEQNIFFSFVIQGNWKVFSLLHFFPFSLSSSPSLFFRSFLTSIEPRGRKLGKRGGEEGIQWAPKVLLTSCATCEIGEMASLLINIFPMKVEQSRVRKSSSLSACFNVSEYFVSTTLLEVNFAENVLHFHCFSSGLM